MTRLRIVAAAALALLSPIAAAAQDIGGAWKVEGDRVALRIAKVGFPTRVAGLTLTKTGEISAKGEALDNFAQYESSDREVFATVYTYKPTYADAALAAYATDQAITLRFHPTAPAAQTSVRFANKADGALRQVFTGAIDGHSMTTAAAFARVDSWLVKIRASGPTDRAAEVTAALDALIAGASVDRKAMVYPARPLSIGDPCPGATDQQPKIIQDGDNGAAFLLAGLSGGSMIQPKEKGEIDRLAAFPANGATAACVRGTMMFGDRKIDLIQPVGTAEPAVALALINDAGLLIAVEKVVGFPGYTVKRYGIGRVEVGARIDRMPTAGQLADWMRARDAPEVAVVTTTTVKADGKTQVNINTDRFK